MLDVEVMGSIEKPLSGPLELENAFIDKPMQQRPCGAHVRLFYGGSRRFCVKVSVDPAVDVRKTKTKNTGSSLVCGMCVCWVLCNICTQTVPQ